MIDFTNVASFDYAFFCSFTWGLHVKDLQKDIPKYIFPKIFMYFFLPNLTRSQI